MKKTKQINLLIAVNDKIKSKYTMLNTQNFKNKKNYQ